MRALLIATCLLGACTPDIVPGSYYCGPNASCPEDQVCSEATNTCGLAASAEPWECTSAISSEPDDTMESGFELNDLDCATLPRVIDACMPIDDSADWFTLTAPPQCSSLKIDVRISFPFAFQRLGLEVVDVATGNTLATDSACMFQGESGSDLRCTIATLTPGARYAIRVAPTGEGDCGGDCAFNSYTVRVQLGPG